MRRDRAASRNQRGTTGILTVTAASVVLLPISLLSFEYGRLHLAERSLKSANDAAVLAGGLAYSQSADESTALDKAKAAALKMMGRNEILSLPINVRLADSKDGRPDNLKSGEAVLELKYDKAKGVITASSAYRLEPGLEKLFGMASQVITANSNARCMGPLDLLVTLDSSASMGNLTHLRRVTRSFDNIKKEIVLKVTPDLSIPPTEANLALNMFAPGNRAQPSFPQRFKTVNVALRGREPGPPGNVNRNLPVSGFTHLIPDVIQPGMKGTGWADFTKNEFFSPFAGESPEFKVALLVAAQNGDLESQADFDVALWNRSVLAGKVTPRPGFRKAYQELAISSLEPSGQVRKLLLGFLDKLSKRRNLHTGLTTFASIGSNAKTDTASAPDSLFHAVSGTLAAQYGYKKEGFRLPHKPLSQESDNLNAVTSDISTLPLLFGTNVGGGLRSSISAAQTRRDDAEFMNVFVTDGISTDGADPINVAAEARKEKLNYQFVHIATNAATAGQGRALLRRVAKNIGNGSRLVKADSMDELEKALDQLSKPRVFLITE